MFVKKDTCKTVKDVVQRNTNMPILDFLKIPTKQPYLKNLHEAVTLLQGHKNSVIQIVGDYDVDGIYATAIAAYGLYMAGFKIKTRLPHRFTEGYGLSEKIIDEVETGVILTVDNGIAAFNAVRKAKEKGLTVIVTDHHLASTENGVPILPDADIIVNPAIEQESEYRHYCGAALAYRLVEELHGAVIPDLLVLAAIATVADVMPLTGANHWLVKHGVEYINNGYGVPGLRAIIQAIAVDNLTEEDFGFLLGPICNASGRIYDAGSETTLSVLLSSHNRVGLMDMVQGLLTANQTRKKYTEDAIKEAEKICQNERPIVIYNPNAGEGIIGLVAGKLCEKYQCPVICFTDAQDGLLKGSGRSIPEIHLKNTLDRISNLIVAYGGHAGAAGLSIKKADFHAFQNAFRESCGEIPPMDENVYYDLEIEQADVSKTVSQLNLYAPYGNGNEKILFRIRVHVKEQYFRISKDGKHIMYWENGFKFVGFRMSDKFTTLKERHGKFPEVMDCVGYLTEEWYQGKANHQLQLVDFTFE